MDYGYTSSKYYSSSDNQYSSEDSASYTTESKCRSCSPLSLEQLPTHRHDEFHIPTRQQFITTSKVAYNPLQFISQQRSAAVELSEQARQQIEVVEQQKRILEGIANRMPRQYTDDDDDASWQSHLDAWLSKRKAVTSRKDVDCDTAKQMQQRVPLKSVPELRIKDKEEILTISSSSPLDEHTDSGIENNRSNSNLQSPSTSLDFSPRSDSRQSGYQSGSFSPRYFIRATSPSPIGAVPLTPPPPLPNAAETVNVLRKSVELEDVTAPSLVGTLLQIDTNKDIRRNKDTKIDQTVIGYGLTKKSYGSDYSSIGGRTPYSDSENEFLTPVSTEFTKDESEILKYDRATPADSRVDSALPEQDYDSTLSESNSGTLEALERLAVQSPEHSTSDVVDSRCSSDDNKQQSGKKIKGISLGVELQREQSANITAVKFPLKKQNYAAEKTFRTQRYSLSATEPSDTDLTPSSTVSSTENTSSSEIRESAKVVAKKEAEETMKNSVGAFADKTNALKNVVEANKDGIITMNIDLGYQSKNSRKYFGFVVGGGKDKEVPPFVENVIPGTPAEDAGLKIGDVILSINGELVEGRYHQTIMRMLREAGVLGEVELQIVRPEENQSLKSGSFPYVSDKSGTNSFRKFDEKRAKFDEKTTESTVAYKVQQFKKQCQTSKWCNQRENLEKSKQIKTPPPTPPKTVALHRVVEEPAPTLQTQCAPEARQMPTVIASTSIPRCSLDSDYRVTSFDEKPGPGKLADFIPEVERGKLNNNVRGKSAANDSTCSSLRRETDVEEPKVLRNFDVSPTKSIPITIVPAVTKSKRESERNGEMENNLKAQMDSREWRHYIEEQRYPSGTKSATDDGERCHSLNSPTNEACSSLPNSKKHQSSSHCHLPPVGITEATRLNKVDVSSSAASPVVERRPKIYHYTQTHTQQFKRSGLYNTGLSSSPINERGKKGISGWSDENMAQQEPILSVSGKHRCSHCQMELGRGAAMIIESLNLFYHLSCFRCYVCNAALSNGAQGADVRVRDSKLHCQNCYHNEEAGLKYSQV